MTARRALRADRVHLVIGPAPATTAKLAKRSGRRRGPGPKLTRVDRSYSRPVLTTRHGVRPLGTPDLDAFLALTGRDPVVNVFAEHRARTTNLEPRWLGRGDVGPVRRRRPGRGVPRGRQPGAGRGDAGRRPGLRGTGAGPQPQRLDDRRPARRGRGLLEHGRGPVGPAAGAALAAAAPPDRPRRRWSRATPTCAGPPAPTSTCSTRRAWRCTPRRSASRPSSAAVPSSTGRACSS